MIPEASLPRPCLAPHSGTSLPGLWEARAQPHWALSAPAHHSQEPLQNEEEAESFTKEAEKAVSVPSLGLYSFLVAAASSPTPYTHGHPQMLLFLNGPSPIATPNLHTSFHLSFLCFL